MLEPRHVLRHLVGCLAARKTGFGRKTGFVRKIGEWSGGRVSGDRGRARRGMVLVAEERLAWPKRTFRAACRNDWIIMVAVLAAIGGGMAAIVFTSG
jgi:hypothetical protein